MTWFGDTLSWKSGTVKPLSHQLATSGDALATSSRLLNHQKSPVHRQYIAKWFAWRPIDAPVATHKRTYDDLLTTRSRPLAIADNFLTMHWRPLATSWRPLASSWRIGEDILATWRCVEDVVATELSRDQRGIQGEQNLPLYHNNWYCTHPSAIFVEYSPPDNNMLKMEVPYLILKVYIIFLWYFLCVFFITVNISALWNKSYFINICVWLSTCKLLWNIITHS